MSLVKENLFYCNVSVSKPNKIAPKIIPYYDLTFVLKGRLTYIVNGAEYILEENDAILIRPGSLRERLVGDNPAKYVSFNFLMGNDIPVDIFLKGIITSEVRALVSAFPQRHISPFYHAKEKTECILNYILYEIMDVSLFQSKNPHILEIMRYIENNLSQKLSLAQISRHVHLTKEYAASLFKKETGKTVTRYINERKMIVAKNMIATGTVSLKDVAISLGFENYSYFSRLFKKYHDSSPVKRKNA